MSAHAKQLPSGYVEPAGVQAAMEALARIKHGQIVLYHRGFLMRDVHEGRPGVADLARLAYKMAWGREKKEGGRYPGRVDLWQIKEGPGQYLYFATGRSNLTVVK